jgi:ribulose-5-phosphate 4-epimerase/fuculose-1-phosphate aldolase
MPKYAEYRRQVVDACHRLAAKKLVGDGGDSFSIRIPGEPAMVAVPPGTHFSRVSADEVRIVSFGLAPLDELPPLVGGDLAVHAAVYRTRGDSGAIVHSHQQWASALRLLPRPMPGIFDEQVRQLGRRVERLPFSNSALSKEAIRKLKRGDNAFLFGNGVLLLGMTCDRAVFNAELIEKCAKAYVLACATGRPVGTIPLYVRVIAGRRLLKDERRSAESYARGEVPTGFTAY